MSPEQNDLHFEALLAEVLHEQANPPLPAHFHSRLTHTLKHPQGAPVTSTFAPPSIPSFLVISGSQPPTRRSLRSLFTAALVHVVALLLIAFVVVHHTQLLSEPNAVPSVTMLELPRLPVAPPKAVLMGGGGGHAGPTPVTRGTPPKFAAVQLNSPKAPPLAEPKIAIPVTIDVQPDLQMAAAPLPQIGLNQQLRVEGRSLGNGKGTGLGAGTGAGLGAGNGGNTGGGIERIGGGISAPIPTYQPEPEFSEEARKAKVAGNVLVYLQVDEQGRPQHVRVLRGLGLGLDQKAIAAVQQYRFKPAMKNGHPVTVEMNIDVLFQIF